MYQLFALLMSVTFIASPIWPIGENPVIGDPYIIVNKKTNELAFINESEIQKTYQVATGKTTELTPEGEFTIVVKAIDPYYRKRDIEGGSPENPLGTRWIGFDALETDGRIYGIHGTNNPPSIGSYVTAGCIRMFNQQVEELFERVPQGTKILVISSEKTFEQIAKEYGAI
ncbi:L,D-transpeptidase [Bacillus sp. FJAT-45350]|uniref:L,D-transpeptidase n=1 Tax=Bacillus sp. FJAT-45350 TaxID=2011014 RepID=UPI000BB956E7|nr:L,D-transpeptidase [Bacillus sp. FJAT-45350]